MSDLTSITDFMHQVDPVCVLCLGEGLVCEDHPTQAWRDGDGCCGQAGMPCYCTQRDGNLLVEVLATHLHDTDSVPQGTWEQCPDKAAHRGQARALLALGWTNRA